MDANKSPVFYNKKIDKGELKRIIRCFILEYGPTNAQLLLDRLKTVGFHSAAMSGLSLGIEDLKTPPTKKVLINTAQEKIAKNERYFSWGEVTPTERFHRIIDVWTTASENLKNDVISHFQETDPLNPLYVMAFSGARGNISQVRQLVGMRGLMSDPQGQIIDTPIQTNFREGLKVTEYMISCYGARKGLVDTALGTATAGYLTRRLVDVAHAIRIDTTDCGTTQGIFTDNPTEETLVGRVFSETLVTLPLPHEMYENTLRSRKKQRAAHITQSMRQDENAFRYQQKLLRKTPRLLTKRNVDISPTFAQRLCISLQQNTKKKRSVFSLSQSRFVPSTGVGLRSPLTCESLESQTVCQLCYGWTLSYRRLVSIGEAVGVLAAQSIGEPGTQLTMRTFHTGGIFSGGVQKRIEAIHEGFIAFPKKALGADVRLQNGQPGFFSLKPLDLLIYRELPKRSTTSGSTHQSHSQSKAYSFSRISLPPFSAICVQPGQHVYTKDIIAELSFLSEDTEDEGREMGMVDTSKDDFRSPQEAIFAKSSGQLGFEDLIVEDREDWKHIYAAPKVTQKPGFMYLLEGEPYTFPTAEFLKKGDFVTQLSLPKQSHQGMKFLIENQGVYKSTKPALTKQSDSFYQNQWSLFEPTLRDPTLTEALNHGISLSTTKGAALVFDTLTAHAFMSEHIASHPSPIRRELHTTRFPQQHFPEKKVYHVAYPLQVYANPRQQLHPLSVKQVKTRKLRTRKPGGPDKLERLKRQALRRSNPSFSLKYKHFQETISYQSIGFQKLPSLSTRQRTPFYGFKKRFLFPGQEKLRSLRMVIPRRSLKESLFLKNLYSHTPIESDMLKLPSTLRTVELKEKKEMLQARESQAKLFSAKLVDAKRRPSRLAKIQPSRREWARKKNAAGDNVDIARMKYDGGIARMKYDGGIARMKYDGNCFQLHSTGKQTSPDTFKKKYPFLPVQRGNKGLSFFQKRQSESFCSIHSNIFADDSLGYSSQRTRDRSIRPFVAKGRAISYSKTTVKYLLEQLKGKIREHEHVPLLSSLSFSKRILPQSILSFPVFSTVLFKKSIKTQDPWSDVTSRIIHERGENTLKKEGIDWPCILSKDGVQAISTSIPNNQPRDAFGEIHLPFEVPFILKRYSEGIPSPQDAESYRRKSSLLLKRSRFEQGFGLEKPMEEITFSPSMLAVRKYDFYGIEKNPWKFIPFHVLFGAPRHYGTSYPRYLSTFVSNCRTQMYYPLKPETSQKDVSREQKKSFKELHAKIRSKPLSKSVSAQKELLRTLRRARNLRRWKSNRPSALVKIGMLVRFKHKENTTEKFDLGQIIRWTPDGIVLRSAKASLLPKNAEITMKHGDMVYEDDILFSYSQERSKTGDIVQGLPKINRLFEGRRLHITPSPAFGSGNFGLRQYLHFDQRMKRLKNPQPARSYKEMVEHPTDNVRSSRKARGLSHESRGRLPKLSLSEVKSSSVSRFRHKKLKKRIERVGFDGFETQRIRKMFMAQSLYRQKVMSQIRLLVQIQNVYKSQGVTISDKHIELIIRQMTGKVLLLNLCDIGFFPGDTIDELLFKRMTSMCPEQVFFSPILLGVSQLALHHPSILAPASFQETKRVLVRSALSSRIDFLGGIKEHVMVGNLIPAGTGVELNAEYHPFHPGVGLSEYQLRQRKRRAIPTGVSIRMRLFSDFDF